MSSLQSPPPEPPEAPWPPLWARKVGFFFGFALMTWEATLDELAHMWVFGFAYVLTGLPIAKGVEKVFDSLLALLGRK
jgi:hypothetical protein